MACEVLDTTGAGPDWRRIVAGLEAEVPVLGGDRRPYVNLDNAATTPPFTSVLTALEEFTRYYSSVHRGTGYKSRVSTEVFDECRNVALEYFGADPDYHICIFCANTTDAINYLSRRLHRASDDYVVATVMEHHSNMLPWRFSGPVAYIEVTPEDGSLDLNQFGATLDRLRGRVRLVTLTGASNVTGCMPPIHRLARLAHEHGAMIAIDAAQLAGHRPIVMGNGSDPERIDFLACSGHKMYAPFGSGVLIGPREFFASGAPSRMGGGAVEIVTLEEVEWSPPPEREEAGTPNLMGVLAMARAMQILRGIGLDAVAAHERQLRREIVQRLIAIPGVRIYGTVVAEGCPDRIGVIPFLMDGVPHALLAAALSNEWGIGVRHGCFCAHPYVLRLLHLDAAEIGRVTDRIRKADRRDLPGFVRISLALYNTLEEVEYLAHALSEIRRDGPRGAYRLDRRTGEYHLTSGQFDLEELPGLSSRTSPG